MKLGGVPHLTAITGDAPRNVDFYARVLGLRLVKKSVNQDDPTVYHLFYGDEFKIACPTGSGNMMTLFEVSRELASRLTSIFLRDENGRRPVFGGSGIFQNDPFWRDNLLFYEYFHGDNGAGVGASNQTGWTGVVARLIQLFGYLRPEDLMAEGTRPTTLTFRRASSSSEYGASEAGR